MSSFDLRRAFDIFQPFVERKYFPVTSFITVIENELVEPLMDLHISQPVSNVIIGDSEGIIMDVLRH